MQAAFVMPWRWSRSLKLPKLKPRRLCGKGGATTTAQQSCFGVPCPGALESLYAVSVLLLALSL